MLAESQLRALAEPLWRNFQRLESDLIERICIRIREIGELSATDAHRLDELRRIGFNLTAMQREIASVLNISTSQVYDIFVRAAEMEYNGVRANFALSGREFVPFAENEQLQRLIESYARAAEEGLRNLAHTTGFMNPRDPFGRMIRDATGNIAPRFQPLSEYYQSVIDYATLQVRTGQTDFDSAMRQTIRAMADHGFTSVDYESGYHRRMDTAVRANLMDAQARLSMAQAELVGQQFGADGMEVSWHSGARPSHVWIGGIQVTMDEFYSEVQPVMEEPNCYHRAYPIIMGISPPTHTQSELDALNARDAEEHEFSDKSYNAYKAQQRQREYETAIRKWKDRTGAFKAEGDKDAAKIARARARALQAEYARFSDAVHIQIKPARTRVAGFR